MTHTEELPVDAQLNNPAVTAAGFLQMALVSLRLSVDVGGKVQQQHQQQQQQQKQKLQQQRHRERRQIGLREVADHDSIDDCWLVIYDRVYDVTQFMSAHPGGYDVMLEYAGRDASLAFRGCGHSEHAIAALQAFEIGELPAAERIFRCAGKLLMSDLPA